MADIVLFGATGYTGRLTAAALGRRGAKFIVAGRSHSKLEKLAESSGATDLAVASVGDVDALARSLSDARVLVTCVGPFVELGQTAVEAALRAGVHYIDSTGEGVFIEKLIADHDSRARDAGIAMAPALGFDEVPADVAATLASEGLGRADLVLTYALPSFGSRGTVRSALGIATSRGPWIEDGRVRMVRAGEETRWSPMPPPLGPRRAASFPLAEGHLAPLHLDLNSLRLFITAKRGRQVGMKLALPLVGALGSKGTGLFGRFIDRAPEGPTEEQRPRQRWTILAEARSSSEWRNVALVGTDPYGLTAEFLATGAMEMARDGYDKSGVLSPVQAVGLDTLTRELAAHGVSTQIFS